MLECDSSFLTSCTEKNAALNLIFMLSILIALFIITGGFNQSNASFVKNIKKTCFLFIVADSNSLHLVSYGNFRETCVNMS